MVDVKGKSGFGNKIVMDVQKKSFDGLPEPVLHPAVKVALQTDPQTYWGDVHERLSSAQISAHHRNVLVDVLTEQYADFPTAQRTLIRSLKQDTTYTCTTGHQVGVLAGPMFLFMKIASAIRWARAFNKEIEGKTCIPVFWMATEDHDVEEVFEPTWNVAQVPTPKVQEGQIAGQVWWNTSDEWEQLKKWLVAHQLPEQYVHCLKQAKSLADLTRRIVHYYFPNDSLIVLDPNDGRLKKLAVSLWDQALFTEDFQRAGEESAQRFKEQGWRRQIQFPPINLFYLDQGIRKKIKEIRSQDIVLSSGETVPFSACTPENWSPNVVLRPVYQQMIHPNVMYFGGAAEVCYWNQLQEVFAAAKCAMPLVGLRHSFGLMREDEFAALQKTGRGLEVMLMSVQDVEEQLLHPHTRVEQEKLAVFEQKMEVQLREFMDEVLKEEGEAFRQGVVRDHRKVVRRIGKKHRKQARQAVRPALETIQNIRASFMVEGVLQERILHPENLHFREINWMETLDPICPEFVFGIMKNTGKI